VAKLSPKDAAGTTMWEGLLKAREEAAPRGLFASFHFCRA
jgi:hypothetical protein